MLENKQSKLCFVSLFVVFCETALFGQEPILSGPPAGIIEHIAVVPDENNTVITASFNPFTGLLKSSTDGMTWDVLNNGLSFGIPPQISTINGLVLDPIFPDTMFVIIRTGNSNILYRSVNGGMNWQQMLEESLGYSAITVFNNNLYVYIGGLLLYSHNGGDSFQILNNTIPPVNQLMIPHNNFNELYAGTASDGLYYSNDGGNTFIRIGFANGVTEALDVVSTDTSRLVAASVSPGGVYISADSGATWISRNQGLPSVTSLLFSPENFSILYAGTWEGVYKTTDQGLSWFPANNGLEIPTIFPPEPVAVLSLAIDPNNTNTLYAGTDRKGLFKTTNAAQEWYLMGIPSTVISGLSVSALNPELLYVGSEDGFYAKKSNRWVPTSLWGGETSGIKSLALSPVDSNLIVANYRNAIFTPLIYKSTDGGVSWNMTQMLFDGSEVLDIIFDSVFPERVYGVWWWGLASSSGLIISDDSGDTWNITYLNSSIDLGQVGSEVIQPLAINPLNSDELYLLEISGEVHKSNDRGISWTQIRPEQDTAHFAIAIDPFDQNNIYISTYSVWKSEDGGNNWLRTKLNKWTLDIVFDETTGYLYAATYGSGVFYTTDGGITWDSLSAPANPFLYCIDIGEGISCSNIYAGSFGTGVFEWTKHIDSIQKPNNKISNFELMQNYPNPFNSLTYISFRFPKPSKVRLEIINLLGQIVKILISQKTLPAGLHKVMWDGKNSKNQDVSSGLYFYRLSAKNFARTRKLILLR